MALRTAFLVPVFALTVLSGGNSAVYSGVQSEMVRAMQIAEVAAAQSDNDTALAHLDLVLVGMKRLSIGIKTPGAAAMRRDVCEDALAGAVGMWEVALSERPFRKAATNEKPDIEIQFCSDVERAGQALGGFVTWHRRVSGANGTTTAEIQVRVCLPSGGWMSSQVMQNEIAHELGHVLGLTDDPVLSHVMSPLNIQQPVFIITHSEVAGLQQLRAQARSLRQNLISG